MMTAAKLRWYVHRMRAMSPAEVGHRFAEKYRHVTQERYVRKISAAPWDECRTDFPHLPDRAAAPAELRMKLAADAQRLQEGRWRLFGWQEVEVGSPPDWHRDPVCGVAVDPSVPAHRLNHRQLAEGADARRLWEMSRWAEVTRLAMHGWVNEDRGALECAQRWLADWCDRNPAGQGIHWTSPLEAALRLINFCWIDALVRACGAEGKDVQDRLAARIVPIHAGWVWRHRSAGSSANNHLLGELAAVVMAAARWPGLERLTCSAATAWQSLEQEVLRQFAGDGGSREQALHYHLFAWDLAWQAASAVKCREGPAHERLIKAARFFTEMTTGGQAWDFGDSDDAQVLPFTLDRSQANAEWKAWLEGQPGALRFWQGEPSGGHGGDFQTFGSWSAYPESGMAVIQAGGWTARLDASPLGFGTLAAHGHCDALHVSVWDGDEALIIDPGTGGYFAAPELRAGLADWEAHNGPVPAQGFQTPKRIGTFLQIRHHAAPSLAIDEEGAAAAFGHEGHRFCRRVRVQGEGIEIRDQEETGRPFRVVWQFAPGYVVTLADGNCWRISHGSRQWRMRIAADGVRARLVEKTVARAYGLVETARALCVDTSGPMRTAIEREK